MANNNLPTGAQPEGRVLNLEEYIAAGTIYPGDFVSQEAAGRVQAASASTALVGVAMSYAATAGAKVLVANHPDQMFAVQSDGTSPAAQTDLGLNYNITAGAGNATYKRSGHQIDNTSGATTATLPLRAIRITRAIDNALGANAKVVVKINNHQLNSGTGAAGV